MALHSITSFPSTRTYVLRLHRDAKPANGEFIGRLEHLLLGDHVEFQSGAQLLEWLALHADRLDDAATRADPT